MALVMHPTPVDSPRRSSRIRVRRQTNLARLPCILTHTQSAVSRRILSRSSSRPDILSSPQPTSAVPSQSDAVLIPSHKHGAPNGLLHLNSRASQVKRDIHHGRARASSSSSTATSSSRTKSVSNKRTVSASSALPVLAGTKRKRSQYELVSARPEAETEAAKEAQTPRQLRYAKRQRLLVARSGNYSDSPAATVRSHPLVSDPAQREDTDSIRNLKLDDGSPARERVLLRASTQGRLLSLPPSISSPAPAYTQFNFTSSSNDSHDTPSPPERPPRSTSPPPSFCEPVSVPDVPSVAPKAEIAAPCTLPTDVEEQQGPTITPIPRGPLPPRERRPDTIDQGLWKIACQERVEHLKEVYRDLVEAVLRAEALIRQNSSGEAPHRTATPPPSPDVPEVHPQAEFMLYTPSTCKESRVDADGDADMDYSSDWDSDEDEEEDDDFMDTDLDGTLPTYDEVLALDGAADPSYKPGAIKLPPLSSIPVFALEGVPEPTGRNGVPFMGRGTPVDRQRRADWATLSAPLIPISLRFTPSQWSPTPPPTEYYSPSPEMAFSTPNIVQVNPGMHVGYDSAASMQMPMQVDLPLPAPTAHYEKMSVNMNVVPQFEHQYNVQPVPECMPWLDPALRTESTSPSPSPVPTAIVLHSLSSSVSPPTYPLSQEYPTPIPVISTSSPDFGSSCSSTSVSSVSTSGPEGGLALGSPNSTGCAWHATFLECLQSSGCAPFFASQAPVQTQTAAPALALALTPPAAPVLEPFVVQSPSPVMQVQEYAAPGTAMVVDMGVPNTGVGAGVGVFPDPELAQFVRSHLVPGSVTLSHALG